MKTYKLFRFKSGKLFPLYVFANEEVEIGKWLDAKVGDKADETHVKSRLGALSLRPGWHSTTLPFTDWIGQKMPDGTLAQRANTVWCECEVKGEEIECKDRYGFRELQRDKWYYFRTNSKQKDPWIISDWIKINKILSRNEVVQICEANGIKAQGVA